MPIEESTNPLFKHHARPQPPRGKPPKYAFSAYNS
jgi:hypothetical protein